MDVGAAHAARECLKTIMQNWHRAELNTYSTRLSSYFQFGRDFNIFHQFHLLFFVLILQVFNFYDLSWSIFTVFAVLIGCIMMMLIKALIHFIVHEGHDDENCTSD